MTETADRDANRALRARFEEVHARYQRLRSGMDEMQRSLGSLRVRGRSEDGLVEATVGPRGQLVDLRIDPRAYQYLTPAQLADRIVDVTAAAAEQVTHEIKQTVSGYLPPDSGALAFLEDNDFGSLLGRQDAIMNPPDPGDHRG